MSSALITTLARSVAAPIISSVLADRLGPRNAQLAEAVINAVAARAGVSPLDLGAVAEREPGRIERAVEEVEQEMPQILALHHAALEHQFELLQAEMTKPVWTWAWRPVWMYFLIVVWAWNIIGLHLLNAVFKWALPAVDWTTLLAVTSLFMGLYMGGHTVKAFAKSLKGSS